MTPAYPGPNATRQQVAQWMGAHATAAGLPRELPVMAGLVESGLRNLPGGDRDSQGFFQMRKGIWDTGAYAGYANNPDLQMRWFIDQARKAQRGGNLGEWVANIERPAEQYRGRYQQRLAEARSLLGASGSVGPAPTAPAFGPPSGTLQTSTAPSTNRLGMVQGLLDSTASIAKIPKFRIPENLDLRVEMDTAPRTAPADGSAPTRQAQQHPPSPDQLGQALVRGAKQFLGVKYVWGGEDPSGFDCSGLMQYVYHQFGINVPRVSQAQFQAGMKIDPAQAQPGDMVFFRSSGSATAPGHVGMALGNGQFIQAPRTGDVVKISNLADRSDLVGVRRYR